MTSIVSLVRMPPGDIEHIRREFPDAKFKDAAGWFDGEYAQTWPVATVTRYVPGAGRGTRQERDELLAGADVIIAGFPFPLDLLARSPNLKWVHQTPAGASNLRRGDLWGADIAVTTSRGLGETTAIAEYVMASAMYFLKGFFRARLDLDDRVMRHLPFDGKAVETKTVCVIGAGGIGQEVGRLAKAMGMRVIGTRRSQVAAPGDEYFDRLEGPAALFGQLAEADVVAVCSQWTPATTDLLDDRAFAAMPEGCVVVNVARGEIIDEDALYRALESGRLRGAALDVFVGEFEHLPPDRLWSHPRVLITPHTSGMTDSSRRRSTDLFCANLRHLLEGRPLENLVDWELGY